MKILKEILKINRKVQMATALISGITASVMIVMISADVFMRNFFNSPIAGVYELTQYACMPLCVFPALAFAYAEKVLPKFEGISKHGNPKVRIIFNTFTGIIEIVTFSLVFYFSWQFAMNGLADHMAVTAGKQNLPIWPFYFFSPIGFTLLLIEIVITQITSFIDNIKAIRGGKNQENIL